MHRIVKYGLVTFRDHSFLINRKYGTKWFLLPGGKPEHGESALDCLVREIAEEHGCEVLRSSLKLLGTFEDRAANEPNTIISITVYSGDIEGEPTTQSEIQELRWFGINDDETVLSPVLRNKILPFLKAKGDFGYLRDSMKKQRDTKI